MRVLIEHGSPFIFAHGGVQVQIEQTYAALRNMGVEVEYLRWWDADQRGDVVHHFGRPAPSLVRYAQAKGMRFVVSELLGGMGARPLWRIRLQRLAMRIFEATMPGMLIEKMLWETPRLADCSIALTTWEEHLLRWVFRAKQTAVIPNGVEAVFLADEPAERGKWLVTTASVLPVKRVLETAKAAVEAGVPYWVVGRPFAEDSAYYQEFLKLQRANPKVLRYEGPISGRAELARVYRQARGFVMWSLWESLSISAIEACACRCPLLLTDLPWARAVFGNAFSTLPRKTDISAAAARLREFYDAAPNLKPPPKPASWPDVARQVASVYERVLTSSR